MKDLGYHYVSFRFDTKSELTPRFFRPGRLRLKTPLSALIGAVLGEKRLDKV